MKHYSWTLKTYRASRYWISIFHCDFLQASQYDRSPIRLDCFVGEVLTVVWFAAESLQWMLVTVVILFLITELPQGLLAMCSGLVHGCFESYYLPLGDTMDVVALCNNAINFALYCTMSSRFRLTFTRLLQRSNANRLNMRNTGSVMLNAPRRFVSRASVSICEPNQFHVVNNWPPREQSYSIIAHH